MLISFIVAACVSGMTYCAERAIDRTIQQGRAIKNAGGSIRQTLENTAAGMVSAAVQPPVPQPEPVRYDADEFDDDDDDFFCDCDDIIAEESPADEEPETITAEVIEEPEQPVPEQPRDPVSGQFKKKKKKK